MAPQPHSPAFVFEIMLLKSTSIVLQQGGQVGVFRIVPGTKDAVLEAKDDISYGIDMKRGE